MYVASTFIFEMCTLIAVTDKYGALVTGEAAEHVKQFISSGCSFEDCTQVRICLHLRILCKYFKKCWKCSWKLDYKILMIKYSTVAVYYHLYHAIENTANQNSGKLLYICRYLTQPSHRVLRIASFLPIVFSMACIPRKYKWHVGYTMVHHTKAVHNWYVTYFNSRDWMTTISKGNS